MRISERRIGRRARGERNDRGLVLPAGGYGSDRFGINLDEMRLLRRANKRFYTLAYGADYRLREKTLASGKFNFCMHCPEVGKFCLCEDAGGARVLETIGSFATAMLASGLSLEGAVRRATQFVTAAIAQHLCWETSSEASLHALNHSPNDWK